MELAVIDLETTGTSAERDRIVEIAVVRVRGGEIRETWSSLVHADVPVGASASVHRIEDAMLASAPSLPEAWAHADQLVRGAALVAHRAAFDLAFLDAAAARGEITRAPDKLIDTAALAERALGESGLSTLARRVGGRAPTHRALPDALAALDVLHACVETFGEVDADELADLSRPTASMRREVSRLLQQAHDRREPVGVLYRPASGRAHEDLLTVERLAPPYATGTFETKRGARTLRGDRFVRAWFGARPLLRFC